MSRGLGVVQAAILDELRRGASQTLTENSLLWRVAERLQAVEPTSAVADGVPTGGIPDAFYKSFRRALPGLYGKGIATVIERRKFLDADEVCAFYPDRTRRLEIRFLRQRLLRTIVQFGARAPRRTTSSEREECLLAECDSSIRAECARRWNGIRDALLNIQTRAQSGDARDIILRLHVKCVRYFDLTSTLSVSRSGGSSVSLVEGASFAELIALSESHVPSTLRDALIEIYQDVLSTNRLHHGQLKDILFRIGHFDSSGYHRGPRLKDDVKEHLLERFPEIITALPRYRPGSRRRRGFEALLGQRPSHDPILDQVIDRHVFDQVVFVQPKSERNTHIGVAADGNLATLGFRS